MNSTPEPEVESDDDQVDPKLENAQPEDEQTPPSKDKPRKPLLRTMARAAFFLGATMLLLGFLFSLLGRYFYLAEVLGHLRLYHCAALLFCCLVSVMGKRYRLAVFLAIAAAWSATALVSAYLPGEQPTPGKTKLHVMSFNLLGVNQEFEKTLAIIRDTDPDVITLIEYANEWSYAFASSKNVYPYEIKLPRWHGYGIAILSKVPIKDGRTVQLIGEHMDCPMIEANLEIDGQTLRLLSTHLLSPTNPFRAKLRNQQIREIIDVVNDSDEPTVLMGDFNCTPWSPYIGDLMKETGMRDSRQGFGYQATFHNHFPIVQIPIDHAFVSPQIHVHNRYVGEDGGSDHLPIHFEISIASE